MVQVTSDKNIVDAKENFHIEFDAEPTRNTPPSEVSFCQEKVKATSNEIKNVLDKGAIAKAEHSDGEYISSIFTRDKKN